VLNRVCTRGIKIGFLFHHSIDSRERGLKSCTVLHPLVVFRTVQSARPGGGTGRTAGGSPSFLESMDGLGGMELGPDPLPCPVGPCGVVLFGSLLLVYLETSSSRFHLGHGLWPGKSCCICAN